MLIRWPQKMKPIKPQNFEFVVILGNSTNYYYLYFMKVDIINFNVV